MPLHTDTLNVEFAHVFVLPATNPDVSDIFDGEDPPAEKWVCSITDGDTEIAVIADDTNQLGDFIARITVQAATVMRAAGVDLPGRIHASLAVAGLLPRGGHDTTPHDHSEGTR
ncbi:hypothetical protein [Nonomuraea sp. NPDC049141]|uniref:hypothetical protein n=1 Tax=Nonomuraea sp. NPDC049141 TaxID=3155500 RepID=UPI0033E92870